MRAHYSEQVARVARLAVETRDSQRLLQEIPAIAAQALHVRHAVIYLLGADSSQLRIAAEASVMPGDQVDTRMRDRLDELAGLVAAEGTWDVEDHRHGAAADVHSRDLESEFESALAVPLLDCGRVIGVLAVCECSAMQFDVEDVRLLETLSSLLAASLQRACSDEALSHSERLKSVGQLAGGVAHDFNNLLTVISGNLQVLEDLPAVAADASIRHMVEAASRAARRGAQLTSKLLAFSRRQELRPARVDLAAMLHPLADMLGRTLDQRVLVSVDVASGCPPCFVDPGQLESALLNLAINARDAMPEGGRLSFNAWAVPELPPGAGAQGAGEAGYVAIAVGDTGWGMTDAVKRRALEPFFTTKEAGHGTGLGLSTVFGFIHQSRGAMALDSTPGKGTTITLFLPQQGAAEVAAQDHAVPAGVPRGLRVLLVEDDAEVRAVAESFLASAACELTACASAEQALAQLALRASANADAPFDLLLTDVALGAGMRGTELAREAQRLFPAMPVLLVSGLSADLLEAHATWPLLRKPYTRAELARAIAHALP